jgi:hypothetical protein
VTQLCEVKPQQSTLSYLLDVQKCVTLRHSSGGVGTGGPESVTHFWRRQSGVTDCDADSHIAVLRRTCACARGQCVCAHSYASREITTKIRHDPSHQIRMALKCVTECVTDLEIGCEP